MTVLPAIIIVLILFDFRVLKNFEENAWSMYTPTEQVNSPIKTTVVY